MTDSQALELDAEQQYMDHPLPREQHRRAPGGRPLTSQKALKNADGTKRFNISQMNAIPIGGYALQMIAMVVFAWLSSRTGWRATWIWIQMVRIVSAALFFLHCQSGAGSPTGHHRYRPRHSHHLASFFRRQDGRLLPALDIQRCRAHPHC